MSKTYNIEIVYCEGNYYILDFTINRVCVGKEVLPDRANGFARGYRQGIEIDSHLKFQPTIISSNYKGSIEDYISERKKYYDELWKVEEENE